MSTTIEQLELEVQSSATSAVSGIDALASSLGKLKSAVKGGVGLTAVAKQLTTLNTALNGVSSANADNLNKLAQGLQTLSGFLSRSSCFKHTDSKAMKEKYYDTVNIKKLKEVISNESKRKCLAQCA